MKRVMTIKWIAVTAAAAAFVAGCLAPPHRFDVHRASRYLERRPDVPKERARALLEGAVVAGMTRDEVVLCLGKPQERQRVADGGPVAELWLYCRSERGSDELERSHMWDRQIPVAKVTFGSDGLVLSCRMYQAPLPTERAVDPAGFPAGVTRPAPVKPVAAGVATEPERGAKSTHTPPTAAAEGTFAGWPDLTVTGVLVGTDAASAIVNRREVHMGEMVDGVRVLQITPQGVSVQMGTEKRFIRTSGSAR